MPAKPFSPSLPGRIGPQGSPTCARRTALSAAEVVARIVSINLAVSIFQFVHISVHVQCCSPDRFALCIGELQPMNDFSDGSGQRKCQQARFGRALRKHVLAFVLTSSAGLPIAALHAADNGSKGHNQINGQSHSAVGPNWETVLNQYRSQRVGREQRIRSVAASTLQPSTKQPPSAVVPQISVRMVALPRGATLEGTLAGAPEPIVQEGDGLSFDERQPVPVQNFVQLSGYQVACAAAQKWAPAHALRARGATVVRAYCDEDESERKTAAAINRFMHLQAANQEDIGAGTALRAYYTRIVLADQLELITDALILSEQEQERLSSLLKQGVASTVDRTQFERKRIGLLDRAAQVDSQDRRLEKVLEQLTDLCFDASGPGLEILEVRSSQLDCDGLVQFAFCNRHDLQSWVYLRSQVNQDTAPVIAKMLSTATGGFALPLPDASRIKDLLCRDRYAQLAADLRRELSCVIQTQRDWIEKTVLEKCSELELAYQRIQFAEQTLQSWDNRLIQVERLSSLGQAVPESVVAAKTERIGAEVELASRRLEAKIAEVELSEACGGITQRCCAQQPWLITGSR